MLRCCVHICYQSLQNSQIIRVHVRFDLTETELLVCAICRFNFGLTELRDPIYGLLWDRGGGGGKVTGLRGNLGNEFILCGGARKIIIEKGGGAIITWF